MSLALYFGSFGDGHFLHHPDGRKRINPEQLAPTFPWSISLLDTGFLEANKVRDKPDGRVYWVTFDSPAWHGFVWWDRTMDSRPGSNSGFYVVGFPPEAKREAWDFACLSWSKVVLRQPTPLLLQP